jgi:hypothetical protein
MKLRYDFDILDLSGAATADRTELGDFMEAAGIGSDRAGQRLALFRDRRTAGALQKAPAALQEYFLKSGFGMETFDSGAPQNRYPAGDEAARVEIIERLAANAGACDLPPAQEGEPAEGCFCLAEFLQHLTEATPLDTPKVMPPPIDAISAPVAKDAAEPAAGGALGLGVIAGLGNRLLRGMAGLRSLRR